MTPVVWLDQRITRTNGCQCSRLGNTLSVSTQLSAVRQRRHQLKQRKYWWVLCTQKANRCCLVPCTAAASSTGNRRRKGQEPQCPTFPPASETRDSEKRGFSSEGSGCLSPLLLGTAMRVNQFRTQKPGFGKRTPRFTSLPVKNL